MIFFPIWLRILGTFGSLLSDASYLCVLMRWLRVCVWRRHREGSRPDSFKTGAGPQKDHNPVRGLELSVPPPDLEKRDKEERGRWKFNHQWPIIQLIMPVCVCPSLSRVCLFVTPRTVAHQAPLSMDFSRQEYWSGLPFPSPGDLPNSGTEPGSAALQADSLPSEPPRQPQQWNLHKKPLDDRVQRASGLVNTSMFWEGGKPRGHIDALFTPTCILCLTLLFHRDVSKLHPL